MSDCNTNKTFQGLATKMKYKDDKMCCICRTPIKDEKEPFYNEFTNSYFHFGCLNYELDRQELCTHEQH